MNALPGLKQLEKHTIALSQAGVRARMQAQDPDANYGLGIAKVVNLDYVEFKATLRTLGGTAGLFDRVPVPLTFPGAGNRHFFGAMPCIGDYCIVGWVPHTASSNNKGGTKTPVILAWMIPGVWPGLDWVLTADFERDEFDQAVPANQQIAEGAHNYVRHKLHHMQPGNIVGSSAQGADLVLDESVTLANRRGNEFILRDQDQAAVLRALQRFDALAGTRTYAGMVQRDANLLLTTMISDGYQWDATPQAVAGSPETFLPADGTAPQGFLTPARLFRKGIPDEMQKNGYLGRSILGQDPYIDPYEFLMRGGFIDATGFVVGDPTSDAVYGGKPIYRVALTDNGGRENGTVNTEAKTFTEYRIEVCHTSDGKLPITEQTDGLDAERISDQDPSASGGANSPFIEWVLGSVIGNDAFSDDGRRKYGLPIRATIFDGDTVNPRLDPAIVGGALPTPIQDHLATLFRLTPPFDEGSQTFWGVDKSGRFKAAIGGDPKGFSAEIALTGGLKLAVGGAFQWIGDGHFGISTNGTNSIDFKAMAGPVTIYGGAGLKNASTVVSELSGTGRGSDDLPSVDIQGKTNVWVQAQKQLRLKGAEIKANASVIDLTGQDGVSVNGVKQVSVNTENFQVSVTGKCAESFAGPKSMLPTSGPLHERTYTPNVPGLICEKVTYTWGDREEHFKLGNHKTQITIGNMTYHTKLGTWKAQACQSTIEAGPSGIKATASVGTVSISASAGSVSITGSTGVTVEATGGIAMIRGASSVQLRAPVSGSETGAIITGGSRDPMTNLPFSTFGMGAPCHQVLP